MWVNPIFEQIVEMLNDQPLQRPFFRSGRLFCLDGTNDHWRTYLQRGYYVSTHWECVDCGTRYPEMPERGGIRCNGLTITVCPYCRPETLSPPRHMHLFGRWPDYHLNLLKSEIPCS